MEKKRKGDVHDPGKYRSIKPYVEVAGKNPGWQNKSSSARGNRLGKEKEQRMGCLS